MENSKHTEGAWKSSLNPLAKNKEYIIETIFDSKLIARVQSEEVSDEESEANAKLIEAAPDLLKALDELQHEVQMQCSIGSDPRFLKMCELWQNAKQAINKATK